MLTHDQIIKKLSSIETMASILQKEASQLKETLGSVHSQAPKRVKGLSEEDLNKRLARRRKIKYSSN